MFFTQGIYDIDELMQYNLHIHTNFSKCAKEEMTFENIIKEAEKSDLKMIALCDHVYQPDELYEFNLNCEKMRSKRDEINSSVKILIGGEFSCYGTDRYTLKDNNIQTEYRLYAQNHFHVTGWERAEVATPEGYKELTKKMLNNLLNSKAADTIAHPLSGMYMKNITGWDTETLGNCWSDNEIGDLMEKAFKSDCSWELNTTCILADPSLGRRCYNIGKEIGIAFTLGTDAHKLYTVDPKNFKDEIKGILL